MKKLFLISLFFLISLVGVWVVHTQHTALETKLRATLGNIKAQNDLAVMYLGATDVPENYKKAAKWYLKAAEQGDVNAQYNIGVLYAQGKGVPQDDQKAIEWYLKAAEQDDVNAQYNLGVMSYVGRGAPQDLIQSYMWFNLAAMQGNENALKNMNGIAKIMSSEQIVKAKRMTTKQLAKHLACYKIDMTLDQLTQCAIQGDAIAQYNLGVMYVQDKEVGHDHKKAFEWWSKAAEQGVVYAQYNLGLMYEKGEGVDRDYVLSCMWFNVALAEGNDKTIAASRDFLIKKMTSDQITKAKKMSNDWLAQHL